MNSNSTTILQLIKKAKEEKEESLDLRYIDEEFDVLPKELFALTDLKTLEIGGQSKLKLIPNEILNLKKLEKLTFEGEFESFPIFLMELKHLKELTLSSSLLKLIPEEIEQWLNLNYLNLGGCRSIEKIDSLPPNLTYLYLKGNLQEELPKSLYTLKKLSKIVLSNYNIKKLPKNIFKLENITSFFFSNSNISTIPKEILNLKKLNYLWLDGNEFKTFPKVLCQLNKLTNFNFRSNHLSKLPDEIIKLQKLKYLNLGNNNFKIIPPQVYELKNLEELNFGNFNYNAINNSANKITELSVEILKLKKLNTLELFQLDIVNVPSEILNEGLDAIKNYFNSTIEADEKEYLYEAKMVIVGRGDVGKSVLTKKLTIPGYTLSESKTTKGIDILKNPWEFKMNDLQGSNTFKFNIWDFGGQEKYDATHQLFITNRSVYLFLTEARAESNYQDVFYWLNTINLLSHKSPIIVVLSKYDERKKVLPESIYKEKFPNIVDFVDVSCADGYEYSIENLKSAISNCIHLLPQTKLTLSNHWIDIRRQLENLSKNQDYIDYSEYLKICKKNKLDEKRAEFLSEYLNDLGVIIHHKHDLLLKKTVFINTDWCVDGMYKVLDDELVLKNRGKFSNTDLETIWSDKRFLDKQPELIRLMKDYGLCFEIADKSGYIAPDLLLLDKPLHFKWNTESNLHFEYHYTFMPTGMVSRFIVKAHNFIKDDVFWKFGVLLNYDETEALVIEDYINNKIKISIRGNNKKGLLSAIKMFINEVHRDFDKDNKLLFEELVQCNCKICSKNANPHFYKFNVLKKFEQKPILEVYCEKSSEAVKVKGLINDVQIQSIGDQIETSKDLHDFVLSLLNNVLEKEIKLKQGNINFWRDKHYSIPKDEIEFQPYICNSLDTLCKVRGINLSREVKEGNGNVDILLTYNNKHGEILKVCIEIKKAHHIDIETSIKTQLPTYLDSVGSSFGIYLIVWFKGKEFKNPLKYKSEDELLSILQKNNPDPNNISVKIINTTKQISPSKKKRIKNSI